MNLTRAILFGILLILIAGLTGIGKVNGALNLNFAVGVSATQFDTMVAPTPLGFDTYTERAWKMRFVTRNTVQTQFLITATSAGDIRFGMTIAEARKILKGAKLTRDMDAGEGVIISVDVGGKSLMWLRTDGGGDDTAPILDSEKIEGIEILDSRFKTANGVHCGMTVSDAEMRLGSLKNIWMEGLTGNELATFSRHPKGFDFWISPQVLTQNSETFQYNTAGIYGEADPDNTTRYEPGAIISMITIPARYEQ